MNPAYLAFALLGLIWGSNFLFMKWASVLISPAQIVFLRVLFGFLPLLVYALATRALSWKQLRHAHHFVVMSLLATSVYYYAFAKGAALLLSSVAGMLSGAIPLFAFVCAWALLRAERPTARMIVGVAGGFIGVLMIARPWSGAVASVDLRGVAYMVAGSLSVGCSFVYARRFLSKLDMSPVAPSTWQIGFALLTIACITPFAGMTHIASEPRAAAGIVLGLGLLGTGIAYILYYYIVQRLGALAASSVTYIPPVVALGIGVVFAHEPIRPLDLLAMVCILGGVFLLQSGRNPQKIEASRAQRIAREA
ncbi:DMT family transporter [Paraburkholderia sp. LEh10]|uniref:DMT family transporter n=1 Tax=Paraburkholderia sp. LEh10 TaxID=2821353 RepID=UPI001AE8EE38|nr:DMT family transporter [Paraburkholderia sp. LEh10]MBP0590062.1 DMT family transporter [Paraburkholderia sp. LEh10]